MICVLLRFVEFPDGTLLPSGVPFMFADFFPTEQYGFMLPLIWGTPQNKALLLPDAGSGKIKAGIRKGFPKIQAFCVGVKNINGCVVRHHLFHVGKSRQQELIKIIVGHVVIFDFPGAAFVIDVVRRVGHHQVRPGSSHQQIVSLLIRTVPAVQPVPA